MRPLIKPQMNLFFQWPEHKLGKELQKMSEVLDRHPEFALWAHEDLSKGKIETGNTGLSADQTLRAATIKNLRGLSYEKLAFNLMDSNSSRAFLMMGPGESYSSSCLQDAVSKISEETWEKISVELVLDAKEQGIEDCRRARVDSTVTDSNIHHPTDSSLLYDCIRVTNRLFQRLRKMTKKQSWRFSTNKDVKDAKTLRYKINNAKNDEERLPLYKDLLKISERLEKDFPSILKKIEKVVMKKNHGSKSKSKMEKDYEQLLDVHFYLEKIIYQTIKRVIKGQSVPSAKKIVSIFEPHTDIIVKDRRETQFGHKVFVTSGKSNMILHCDIPKGNPNDSEMFMKTLNSLNESYNRYPFKVSADGGFASKENVEDAHDLGVRDVCFPKKCNMEITDMVKSSWVYKNLLNWRAGIEAGISFLKRCFGMSKANWTGFDGFKKYIRNGIATFNLMVLARHEIALE
jgi:IS5 family transposase